MPVVTERDRRQEQEATPEFGQRSHEAIIGLANNLRVAPEFTDALSRAFFRRQQFPHDSRNEINSVYFQKGDFGYLVEWNSTRFEPRSHGEPEGNRDLIRSSLTITKYDPKESTEDWSKKVAAVNLTSDFVEGEDHEVLRFAKGYAKLEEDYDLETSWETPHSWRTAKPSETTEADAAIDKLPQVFPELYPTPIKL